MALQSLLAAAETIPRTYIVIATLLLPIFYVGFTYLYSFTPFHPLYKIPGPFYTRITDLVLVYHAYIGDEAQYVHSLHEKYGPTVRIGVKSVDFTNPSVIQPIYFEKGGFHKADYYENFGIDGHDSIFSQRDPTERARRVKPVIAMFSIANVKKAGACFHRSICTFLDLLKRHKENGRVNVLDLARGMALDAVTEYLFGVSFGGLAKYTEDTEMSMKGGMKERPRMGASAVVDSFTQSSRLWYLPPWLYSICDRVDSYFFPNLELPKSVEVLKIFTDRVVGNALQDLEAEKENALKFQTYPMRLLKTGISASEVNAQCQDIIFAATDTIGMNLSTVCFYLAKYPEVYEKLRVEVMSTEITKDDDIQLLPYQNAVIREGFRLSLTNPCRIPRQVTAPGWKFEGTYYPKDSIVSVSTTEMHLHSPMFNDAAHFNPERWLDNPSINDMNRIMIAFGIGARSCVAKGMSTWLLNHALYALVKEDVLGGSRPVADRIRIAEGFSSKVIGGEVDLVWDWAR